MDERVDLKRGKGVAEERWIYMEEDASTELMESRLPAGTTSATRTVAPRNKNADDKLSTADSLQSRRKGHLGF